MKIKRVLLAMSFSLLFVACARGDKTNIKSNDTNVIVDNLDNEDTYKESNANSKEQRIDIDIEHWRNLLVEFGQFNQDFVDSLSDGKIVDLVDYASRLSEKTGYWDVKDFVFQELSYENPNSSSKFPLTSIDEIYFWEISDDSMDTDMYENERETFINLGMDIDFAYSLSNGEIKKAFKQAYEEDDEAFYMDYVKSAMEILISE